ncbi:MAG: phenylalanine--tRNA ligase subunit alpha [Gammaproteobacteria bacterium]|nr:phenylalanine--tRNA ligase subunit alpha [Gammaproteobacteria bacterium]MDH5303031.1 phenylalanine--tRNA ligase subunit alpha [Gammaproteobacteria bacterium]MDH5321193.1 phenylalanine--tRNA ligase subunit alpha [Gammaproteobacteria bacterium]
MQELSDLMQTAASEIDAAVDLAALDAVRVAYLGKKGTLTLRAKTVSQLPVAERPAAGQEINIAKQELQERLNLRREVLNAAALEAALAGDAVDVTLPGRGMSIGGRHPVTRAMARIESIFRGAGFGVRSGPEIEDDFHNFTALNFPANHPARAEHDTFFLPGGMLLRTHTSPVQIRSMVEEGVPIRIIAPGRVYRCDSDQTHTPMFHQVEGLVVDRGVSLANLKAVLHQFVESFFEREARLRFRPSYFPFTEPSAEVDVLWEKGKWLEILGCGMVHPNVLESAGIDAEEFTGYAFGMGVERLAMLRYGVTDLRTFFENDMRFLQQFR